MSKAISFKAISAIPILHVNDVAVNCEFYCKLGFTVEGEHQFEPGMPKFVFLRWDTARVFLSEHSGDGSHNGQIYLYTDDVGALHAAAVAAGLSVPMPVDQPWGCREFEVSDSDGHRLRIGQALDTV